MMIVNLGLVQPRHFLFKCLYQVRKVSGHVVVLGVWMLPLSTNWNFGTLRREWYFGTLRREWYFLYSY